MSEPYDRRVEVMRAVVAVIGPGEEATSADLLLAHEVGRLLAGRGLIVATGGLGGVMEAASQGAHVAQGETLAFLPSDNSTTANSSVDIVIPTGMGEARNALLVASCQAVIAVGGSWGTMSEVSLAMRRGIPCASLAGWSVATADGALAGPTPYLASDATNAVNHILHDTTSDQPQRNVHRTPPAESETESAQLRSQDVWTAFAAVQQHYEADLNLMSTRNNYFLVVASGLIAFESSMRVNLVNEGLMVPVAVGGVALTVVWLTASLTSYGWLSQWRGHLVKLGKEWHRTTGVTPFSQTFIDLHPRWRSAGPETPAGSESLPPVPAPTNLQRFTTQALTWARPTVLSFSLSGLFAAGFLGLAIFR